MGLYLVLDYLPVCEDGQKSITGVVGECPPIAWKARRTRRVVGQYVRQQFPCHPARVLRRISTGVLQRVREPGNETAIVCGLTGQAVLAPGRNWTLPAQCCTRLCPRRSHRP